MPSSTSLQGSYYASRFNVDYPLQHLPIGDITRGSVDQGGGWMELKAGRWTLREEGDLMNSWELYGKHQEN